MEGISGLHTLGRVFKLIVDAVFEEKAGWRGATKENPPRGASTEEQPSQTAFSQKSSGRRVFWPRALLSRPL